MAGCCDSLKLKLLEILTKLGSIGDSAYIYIGYADDDQGNGFTTTFDPSKKYIAILNTSTENLAPSASDFAGLWAKYLGDDGTAGTGPKVYRARLNDYGGINAAVLENTLGGNPVWSRTSAGEFQMDLAGAFPAGKTLVFIGGSELSIAVPGYNYGPDTVYVHNKNTDTGNSEDGTLVNCSIEVLVYP